MFTVAQSLAVSLPPSDVLKAIMWVLLAGIVVIAVAHLLKNWKDTDWFKRCEKFGVWDAIRDIGIALVVAGVVSGVYEWTTRSIDENKKAVNLFGVNPFCETKS